MQCSTNGIIQNQSDLSTINVPLFQIELFKEHFSKRSNGDVKAILTVVYRRMS
jgi:hypothetical protein